MMVVPLNRKRVHKYEDQYHTQLYSRDCLAKWHTHFMIKTSKMPVLTACITICTNKLIDITKFSSQGLFFIPICCTFDQFMLRYGVVRGEAGFTDRWV